MSIFKDLYEDNKDYRMPTRVVKLMSPKEWARHAKWRRQRANRGWSDRDTWGAGDHIAKMTAEMLQHLNDKGMCDWPEWFKLNVKEEGKGAYKNLQQAIDDINNYLAFTQTSWADDLDCEGNLLDDDEKEGFKKLKTTWTYKKNGRKLSEPQIKARIKRWANDEAKAYNKAVKAMQFFGRHFGSFWD